MNDIVAKQSNLDVLVALATNGKSRNTRLAYGRAIVDYAEWYQAKPAGEKIRLGGFTRFSILAYVEYMKEQGLTASTINQRLSALRSMAKELRYADLLDDETVRGITEVENLPAHGNHVGNWLNKDQARALLDAPDQETLKGKQERALVALLMGAALRRSEASELLWSDIQKINDQWVIGNIVGKHNRKRTIPLAPWIMKILLDWKDAAGTEEGKILRAVNKSDKLTGPIRTKGGGETDGGLSPQAIYKQVKSLAEKAGIKELEPHSLRRTWAQTAYRQGCPMDQISLILGHQDMKTTEIYLGLKDIDLDDPFYVDF